MIMRLFSPRRVRNIFICIEVVFCASSKMMAALVSVRPRMKASGARSHRPLAQVDGFERGLDGLGVEFEQRALRDDRAYRALHIALRQVVALGRLRIQRLQNASCGVAAVTGSAD